MRCKYRSFQHHASNLTLQLQSLRSESTENEEASLILEIVHAQHEVHRAEKLLADCVVQEYEKRANLHCFKAQWMQNSVDQMDLNVGWINASVINHGRSRPSVALPSTSTFSKTVSGTDRESVVFVSSFHTSHF